MHAVQLDFCDMDICHIWPWFSMDMVLPSLQWNHGFFWDVANAARWWHDKQIGWYQYQGYNLCFAKTESWMKS